MGYMAYETMARNCSEKTLNARLAGELDRAERVFRKLRIADFGMGDGEGETVASGQWSVASESGGTGEAGEIAEIEKRLARHQ